MSDFINITAANCFLDASGANIASGTLTVIATDAKDKPIPFRIGAGSGQATQQVVTRVITAGSMVGTLQLADPANSSPVNILYRFVVTDNTTNKVSTYPKVFISPTSGAWDFSSMNTGLLAPGIPYVPVVGPPGAPGADGVNGTNGTLTPQQLAVYSAAIKNAVVNLYDNTQTQIANSYINWTTGVVTSLTGDYVALPFIPIYPGSTFMTNLTVGPDGTNGIAFYDANKTYISGILGSTVPLGTVVSVPSTAMYVRFGYRNTNGTPAGNTNSTIKTANTIMVVPNVTVLPASFVSFNVTTATDLATAISTATAPINATLATVTNTSDVATLIDARMPAVFNLLDANAVTKDAGIRRSDGVMVTTSGLSNVYSSAFIPVVAGATYNIAKATPSGTSVYGVAYYNKSKAFVSAGPGLPLTANTNFTVPAGVAYVRMCGYYATWTNFDLPTQMLTYGTTAPASYVPFLGTPPALPSTALSPWAGKKWGLFGDSISADFSQIWQSAVSSYLGMTLQFQDARHGRLTNQIFENYNTATPMVRQVSTTSPASVIIGGVVGNTLAQDITGLDLLIIELGTNKPTNAFGTSADTTATDSFCGNMKMAIEAILTANPSMRLVWITPYQCNSTITGMASQAQFVQLNGLIKDVCLLYSVPVVDMGRLSNINPLTLTTYLRDGVHPTDATFTGIYAPVIQKVLNQLK